MKIYVVTMYRWGDRESHSYVHGIYDDRDLAFRMAQEEKEYRGGNKYYPEILLFEKNTPLSSEDDNCYETLLELKSRYL
jgi:hypothetical protein